MSIEQKVRDELHRLSHQIKPGPKSWEGVSSGERRYSPRDGKKTAIPVFALTALLAVGAVGLVWAAFRADGPAPGSAGPPDSEGFVAISQVAGRPLAAVLTPVGVLVSTQDVSSGAYQLTLLDPQTGAVQWTVADAPTITDLLFAHDSVWGAAHGEVIRLSLEDGHTLSSYDTPGDATGIAATGSYLWASVTAGSGDSLVRLNPDSAAVGPERALDGTLTQLAGSADVLWGLLAQTQSSTVRDASVVRFDVATGEVITSIDDRVLPLGLAAGAEMVWAATWEPVGNQGIGGGTTALVVDSASGDVSYGPTFDAFSPLLAIDDMTWAIVDSHGQPRALAELQAGQQAVSHQVPMPDDVVVTVVSADGSMAWALSEDGDVYVTTLPWTS